VGGQEALGTALHNVDSLPHATSETKRDSRL
jgi:hypothetical protein